MGARGVINRSRSGPHPRTCVGPPGCAVPDGEVPDGEESDGRLLPGPPRTSRPVPVRCPSGDRRIRQGVGALLAGAPASGATAARTASTTGCAAPGSVYSVDEVWIQERPANASARPVSPRRLKYPSTV